MANICLMGQQGQVSYKLDRPPRQEKSEQYDLALKNRSQNLIMFHGKPMDIDGKKSYDMVLRKVFRDAILGLVLHETDSKCLSRASETGRYFLEKYRSAEYRDSIRVMKEDELKKSTLLMNYRYCVLHDQAEYIRGTVLSSTDDDVTLYLVDLMETGTFPKEHLIFAQSDVYFLEHLAIAAQLEGLEFLSLHPDFTKIATQVLSLYMDNHVRVSFKMNEKKGYQMAQVKLVKEGPEDIYLSDLVLGEFLSGSVIEVPPGERKKFRGFVSHVEKNGLVYIQTENSIVSALTDWLSSEGQEILTDLLQPEDNHIRVVKDPVNYGLVYLAPFGEGDDRSLYRAKVIKQDGNRFMVRYVDYGNTSTVMRNELYFIEQIHPGLGRLPFLCTPFRMKFVEQFLKINNFKNTLDTAFDIDVRLEPIGIYRTVVLRREGEKKTINQEICEMGWAIQAKASGKAVETEASACGSGASGKSDVK